MLYINPYCVREANGNFISIQTVALFAASKKGLTFKV